MKRSSIGLILSFNGGYVDTMGFLALAGLFTAHVTGNFVTLGAALAFGAGGVLAKLLALPVFCVVVGLSRFLSLRLRLSGRRAVVTLLGLKLVLFTAAATVVLVHGPMPDGDTPLAVTLGMTLVTAMAIQNGLHRVHLTDLPPSTLMTGTTTQIMLDLADLAAGTAGDRRTEIVARLRRFSGALLAFAVGCAAAALAHVASPTWTFAVPPLLILTALLDRVLARS